MSRHRRNWIVEITVEDDVPYQTGPYTERRAREIEEQVERLLLSRPYTAANTVNAFPLRPVGITAILADFA
jgi:hypothetical protein